MNLDLGKRAMHLSEIFRTDVVKGLSTQEATKRLHQHGQNTLLEAKTETWTQVFVSQFQNPLIYILLVAALIIFFVGQDKLDAFIIVGVLLLNAIIGTVQEGRTKSILETLKKFIKTTTIVIRDGKKQLLDDSQLTVGDIILLQEGERVPADAYVIASSHLQLDESILTGESKAMYKSEDDLPTDPEAAPKNAQAGIVYKGTYVLSGSGKALVFAIGSQTEIGKIHIAVEDLDTEMPLKKEVDRLSHWILIGVIGICTILFVMGLLVGQPLRELLVMLTALFICVVPEGLPVVMTLVLVTGMYRMAKQQVLVKHMQAVEGLGRADVIAVDKTGTLTRNELMVTKIVSHDMVCSISGQGYYAQGKIVCNGQQIERLQPGDILEEVAIASILLHSTEITYQEDRQTFDIKGDPIEAAMYICAQKLGVDEQRINNEYRKLYEIPFDPTLQYHAGFFDHGDQGVLFVVGAPELVLSLSDNVRQSDRDSLSILLRDGLRVVAVASKSCDKHLILSAQEKQLSLYDNAKQILNGGQLHLHALVGIQDSIRTEVPDMVKKAQDAGLNVIMITGDHKDTAEYVAKHVGILKEGNSILVGDQFRTLSDDQLLSTIDTVTVYARLMPHEKTRLISLFHKKNRIIAMTGDGINDAPALVAADLGIAMGGIGTEVAKKAADIILLGDSFANIIEAIQEGRHIFYTLKRVILYFFATNMGEVLIILFALMLNVMGIQFPLPLTAAQILWLNLVTDGFLDISLSMEPQEPDLLHCAWLKKRVHLVDGPLIAKMFFYALPMAIGSLLIFFYYYQTDLQLARTMTLVCMAMFQWFNVWNCRSNDKSLLTIGLLSNRWLVLATTFVLLLQMLLVYAPFMHYIFKTVPLTLSQWQVIIMVTFPIVLCDEIRKAFVRTFFSEV